MTGSAHDRRTFLQQSTALVAVAASGCRSRPDRTEGPGPRTLDRERLRAVAGAVLPESLTSDERERAVLAYEIWVREFVPNAELVHPYGGWEVPYGVPDPLPRWAAQLEALDGAAHSQFGDGFASLSLLERRAVLSELIGDEGPSLPPAASAQHVAVALMAHYFASPAAVNRCYGRAIHPLSCRPIVTAHELPPRLPE